MIFQVRPIVGLQLPVYPAYAPEKKEKSPHDIAVAEFEWLRSTLDGGSRQTFLKIGGLQEAMALGRGVLERLSPGDRAGIAEYLSKIKPRSENDREFVYAMLCMSAPYLVARQLEEDVRLKPGEFRKKNGKYDSGRNNCRHYIFKKIYALHQNAFPEEFGKSLGKKIEGRPKQFDWKGEGSKIGRMEQPEFEAMEAGEKHRYLSGKKVGFVKIAVEDDSKIAEMLKPGDMVWVSLSPNPGSVTAHVGGYTGRPFVDGGKEAEVPIVNIAQPLKALDYRQFVRRARRRGGEVYILRPAGEMAAEGLIRMPERKLALVDTAFRPAEQDALKFAPRKID